MRWTFALDDDDDDDDDVDVFERARERRSTRRMTTPLDASRRRLSTSRSARGRD